MGRRADANYGPCPVCETGIRRRSDVPTCSYACGRRGASLRSKATTELPKEIPGAKWIVLSSGRFALVDEEDYAEVSKWSWSYSASSRGVGYACRWEGRTKMYMHSQIAGRSVDHENGDSLDNRRFNLRPMTQHLNTFNRVRGRNCPSPFKGVKQTGSGAWRMRITFHGEMIEERGFSSGEAAARAYDAHARRLFGEFACLNFPEDGEQSAHRRVR